MGRTRAVIASYVGVLVFASVIFLAAGTLVFWPGLVYVALALVGTTFNHVLVPPDSDLTATRMREAPAGESWDRRLLLVYFLLSVLTFAVAGRDAGRLHSSETFPLPLMAFGCVLLLAGQLLFSLAKRENRFFSATVRIQEERGHEVCRMGPYRVVRHPGYLGMLITSIAFPLVIGSWWAFVPTMLGIAVLVVRTSLEDRLLKQRLAGYAEYADVTRWLLVPGLF